MIYISSFLLAEHSEGASGGIATYSPLLVSATGVIGAGIAIAVLTIAICSQKKKSGTGAGATAVANPASEESEMTLNATYGREVFTMPGPREQQPVEDFEMTLNASYSREVFTMPGSREQQPVEDFEMTLNASYSREVFTMPGSREQQPVEDFEMTQNVPYNREIFTLPNGNPAEANGSIHGATEEGYVINQLVYETIPPVPEKDTENIYEPVGPLFGSGEDVIFANWGLTSELALGTDGAEPIEEKETGKACDVTVHDAREPLTDAATTDDPARETDYVINQLNYENPPKKSTAQ